jgi:hypothetical protein
VSPSTVLPSPDPVKGYTRALLRRPYAGRTTHYDTLGLTPSSTHEEVRQAYIQQALRHHPDRQEGQDLAVRVAAERRMQEANAAWAVLGDRQARAAYDAELGVVSDAGPSADPVARTAAPLAPVGLRTVVRRFAPLLILFVVLAAVLLFTAHAGPAPK